MSIFKNSWFDQVWYIFLKNICKDLLFHLILFAVYCLMLNKNFGPSVPVWSNEQASWVSRRDLPLLDTYIWEAGGFIWDLLHTNQLVSHWATASPISCAYNKMNIYTFRLPWTAQSCTSRWMGSVQDTQLCKQLVRMDMLTFWNYF